MIKVFDHIEIIYLSKKEKNLNYIFNSYPLLYYAVINLII